MHDLCRRVYSPSGLSPTIPTMGGGHQDPKIIVPEATKKAMTRQVLEIASIWRSREAKLGEDESDTESRKRSQQAMHSKSLSSR